MSGVPHESDPSEPGDTGPDGAGSPDMTEADVQSETEQSEPVVDEAAGNGDDPFAAITGLDDLIGEDMQQVAAQRDEYLDALRRLQADFDNFRKRALRQQTETLERATE